MIFQPAYSSSELAGGWSLFQQLRVQGGRPPWTGRPSVTGRVHTHPHSLSLGPLRHTISPRMHSFGMWEETGGPRRKPTYTWREQANRTALWQDFPSRRPFGDVPEGDYHAAAAGFQVAPAGWEREVSQEWGSPAFGPLLYVTYLLCLRACSGPITWILSI